MLDAKMIRANPEAVDKILQKRGLTGALDKFLALDEKRRELLGKVEELKNFRNTSSQQVGQMKKAGEDPTELMGRTENNRVVNFAGHPRLVGRFVDVMITEARSNSLRGRVVGGVHAHPVAPDPAPRHKSSPPA